MVKGQTKEELTNITIVKHQANDNGVSILFMLGVQIPLACMLL